MKTVLLALALVAAATALADTPAPAGLDRLAAILPGTWTTQGQTLDSPVSKAGAQHYITVRDCWREATAYKCVSVVNGTLQLYDIFSWDATAAVYRETRITPQGKQPEFAISVSGDTWTFDQDIPRNDGSVVHYRIVKVFTSPSVSAYEYTYSADGKTWTAVAKGSESRMVSDR
jgi:hypothetical protein